MPRKQRPIEHKSWTGFILKADEAQGIVEAIVNVFGVLDLGDDIAHPNSFKKTIVERANQIKVLDQHNTDSIFNILGHPLEMREVGRGELPPDVLLKFPDATGGLWTQTQYNMRTPEGQGAFYRIADKDVTEYSIGFELVSFDYSKIERADGKKITVRNLREVKLWEYSPVIWGMNEATATVGAKGKSMNRKAESDAPNYGAAPTGQTETCSHCRYFNRVNDSKGYCDKHDFLALQNNTCDDQTPGSTQASRTPAMTGKDMTPDGPEQHMDDMIAAYMLNSTYLYTGWLSSGKISYEEWTLIDDLVEAGVTSVVNGLPPDLAERVPTTDYGAYFMWARQVGNMAIKAGRTLSAQNEQRIRDAVDALNNATSTLANLLTEAGLNDAEGSADTTSEEDNADTAKSASRPVAGPPPPVANGETPTDARKTLLAQLEALEL